MMRSSVIPLPLAGLVLALALLGQEYLLRRYGGEPSFALAANRIGVMTLGVASLALILLPSRRLGYLLGFLVCAALIGWALWLQYGVGLEPCPLCMFQRIAVCAVGLVFLVAFIHNPRAGGATGYATLTVLFAGVGAALAARQVWLQALPKDQVPSCGMGISYMLETLPFADVLANVIEGSGECAEKGWEFWGLAIPGWTFVFFVTMALAAIALVRRD